jgi:hypothetical protein
MMRKGCIVLVLLLVVVVAIVAFLVISTGARTEPVALDASQERMAMVRMTPPDASDVTVIPAAAPLLRQLRKHPVTSDWIDEWQSRNSGTLLPLLLGGSDIVAWRRGNESGFIANPDPLRRIFVRVWLATGRREVAIRSENGFLVSGPTAPGAQPPADLALMLELARPLKGHLFHLQRESSEDKYPPISRPTLTAASISGNDIVLNSRSRATGTVPSQPLPILAYPQNAMVATAASASPEWLGRVERVLPVKLNTLLDRGAMLALYRVDEKTLVPRIEGLVILPEGRDAAEFAAILDSIVPRISIGGLGEISESRRIVGGVEVVRRKGFGYNIDYANHRGNVLIAFDESSMEKYLTDTLHPLALPADRTVWFVRVRPTMLANAIDQLEEREELALLVPDVYESIGELGRWLEYFHGVSSIVVARLAEQGYDAVSTTISAPK